MPKDIPASTIENNKLSLEAQIEALLFVAANPISVKQLSNFLKTSPLNIEKAVKSMIAKYDNSGLRIQRHRGKLQLTTAPGAAEVIEMFLNIETISHLSRAALETLAIICYQQPITRPYIESVRGVNSDSVIRNLLSKGLIEEYGRSEGPGRPILYTTTSDFLQHFGLSTIKDLPPLNLPDIPSPKSEELSENMELPLLIKSNNE